MKIIEKKISRQQMMLEADVVFDDCMVKAVVDIRKELIAIDAELHADLEDHLLGHGSRQSDLWGINFYPEEEEMEDFLEFDSLINIRPSQNNRSRGVEDGAIREKIVEVCNKWIEL